MKLIVIAVLLLVAAATANPIYENDVEVLREVASNEEDWQLIPDTNGNYI